MAGKANELQRFAYSFVLIPQARMRHQPRAASNKPRAPAAKSAIQIQSEYRLRASPAMIRTTPYTARTIRPVLPMFGSKNFMS
jgi:hypothetical protein